MAEHAELFENVLYFLSEGNVGKLNSVKAALKDGGGSRSFYLNPLVTHVISDKPVDKVDHLDCHVLHSDWVTLSLKCGVLLPTAAFEIQTAKLFTNLVFTTSKIPRDDMKKIAVLVFTFGGSFQTKLDSKVTHLITTDTSGVKGRYAAQHCGNVKVVTPDWLLDCLDSDKIVQEKLYHPSQDASPEPEEPSDGGDTTDGVTGSVPNGQSHKELLDSDNAVQDLTVQRSSPNAISDYPPTIQDVLGLNQVQVPSIGILQPQQDANQPKLSEEPQHVQETCQTSEHLQPQDTGHSEHSERTSQPQQNELPKNDTESDTIQSQHNQSQAVSQPKADSMVLETPAQVPKASTESLEQSTPVQRSRPGPAVPCELSPSGTTSNLLKGMVFCFTDYNQFLDTDTIATWVQVVEQQGGKVLSHYTKTRCTHVLAMHKRSSTFEHAFADGKCTASAHWLNSVLTKQKMFPPKNALDFPTSFKWQLSGAEKYSMTLTNYMDEERAVVKDMMKICGVPCTGHLDRNTTHLICKRAEGRKYEKAREWGVQVVNSTFLADTIHNGQLPVVLFPRYTRLGREDEFSPGHAFESAVLLRPWKRFMESYSEMNPDLVDRDSTDYSLSFSVPSLLPSVGALGKHQRDSTSDQASVKRLKLDSGLEAVPRSRRQPVVLVTGISTAVASTIKSAVMKLGGNLTEQGSECTHIVAPTVTRTIKFLCGISVCDHIVTPAWVEQSLMEGAFVHEERFRLVDKDAEQFFGMELSESLAKAKSVKMLQGMCVFSTPGVLPPQPATKEIVRCAGGQLLSVSEVKAKYGRELQKAIGQLLVISTPQEVAAGLCLDFLSCGLTVFSAEMLLTGILRQRLDFSSYKITP